MIKTLLRIKKSALVAASEYFTGAAGEPVSAACVQPLDDSWTLAPTGKDLK